MILNSVTRRQLCTALAGYLLVPRSASAGARCATFGAIRWDAQYCNTKGEPCFEEGRALSPAKWHFRAPVHSRDIGTGELTFDATQQTFDHEIQVAHQAGLGYWAYLAYGKDGKLDFTHSMMSGLNFHRKSTISSRVNYCLISTLDTLGRAKAFDDAIGRICDLFSDRNYQRTPDGRPVLFLYYLAALLPGYWANSTFELESALKALRARSRKAGHGDPFIVLLHGPPPEAEAVRSQIGADAISTYGISLGPNGNAAYSKLENYIESYWRTEAQVTKAGVVPTVVVGWDSRPRKETPPAYDKRDYSRIDRQAHVEIATPGEFATACQKAERFVVDHPSICPYGLVLIYSWNEYSEGGALAPTIGDPNSSMLRAARDTLSSCTK
ncbi:hypothetical protein LQG66_21140 [Bradyrhizobium ontarionense]|uniref:Uncharacterized protein n=1 Tax=Bradyrhizobium ontarionense TaxID=2898149 RepID=A0ABY3R3X8_9BRAD|nr:hypothetical protein [Bradyrhizobium sp. A19]UFZ01819.1 hypothetical protein LQG66_21140 [Bradyrhizobium sp. A19]